jgi:type II secretory pathway pseudopilin PulG
MLRREKDRVSGFTLVELAIVLGVAGILFAGVWRLLSSGNVQMRDQAAATQQAQLISAVNTYLQSSGAANSPTGGGQMTLAAVAANTNLVLNLPSSTAPAGNANCATTAPMTSGNQGLCYFLPNGFSSSTTNSYGQAYTIAALKDGSGVNVIPQSYSFMIQTSGGDTIPDTSGGRISAMIGGDGGFIYTANVCGNNPSVQDWACGAYGTWSSVVKYNAGVGYFGAAGASGHIASRTYYSPSQNLSDNWLARKQIPGDTTFLYNTMSTPFYLGGQNAYFVNPSTATTGGGTISVQGGTIDLGTGGKLTGEAPGAGINGGGYINLAGHLDSSTANSLLSIVSDCSPTYSPATGVNTNSCNYALMVNGGMSVTGFFYANSFYSPQYVYTNSDERLKTNIKTLSDPLADIMKLRPVSFVYKANGKISVGLIAQEVEKVYPSLVSDGPTGYKAIEYEGLISPLIGSVQELKKENDDLKARLRAQEIRQEKLEKTLDKLQHKE